MKSQFPAQLSVQGTIQDGGEHAHTEGFSIFYFFFLTVQLVREAGHPVSLLVLAGPVPGLE